MFKQQARYLVKRRRIELWQQVLVPDNLHRRALIDQVRLAHHYLHEQLLTPLFFVRSPRLPSLKAPILMMSLPP